MYRVLMLALAALLLWGASAWAVDGDENWDEWQAAWDAYNGVDSKHEVAERTLRATQPIYRNVQNTDGSMSQELMYYPSRGDSGVWYNPDQVYGPMWGVPGEAVGLEGYEPFYMMQFLGADASEIPAEYRAEVLRRQAELARQRSEYLAGTVQHDASAQQAVSHEGHASAEERSDANAIRHSADDEWLDG